MTPESIINAMKKEISRFEENTVNKSICVVRLAALSEMLSELFKEQENENEMLINPNPMTRVDIKGQKYVFFITPQDEFRWFKWDEESKKATAIDYDPLEVALEVKS